MDVSPPPRCSARVSTAAVTLALACSPAAAWAQSHVDWWTPSLAVAGVARVRGAATFDVAVDLRVEGHFGDPTRLRLGGFVDGRITGSGELSAAAGASLATHLTGHDGGTSLVLSAGGALHDRGGLAPAVLGRLWWGLRTAVEASSHYEIAVGLWTEARYFPRDGTTDVLLGLSVDPYALALPFIYFASAFATSQR